MMMLYSELVIIFSGRSCTVDMMRFQLEKAVLLVETRSFVGSCPASVGISILFSNVALGEEGSVGEMGSTEA